MLAHPDKILKRDLGAYYTPEQLCSILSGYGIRLSSDTVLEPCFGGCGLIKHILTRLHELKSEKPVAQICGCDVDSHAFDNLPNIVGRRFGKSGARFVKSDFLSLKDNSFLFKKFDAVIANPPYITYRKMTDGQKNNSIQLKNQLGISGGRYAGTWYYFLLKSFLYLKKGGRLAFVLPYALIDAEYAEGLREFIANNFQRSAVFAFGDRLFLDQGTKERVVVLVAEGWMEDPISNRMEAFYVKDLSQFRDKIDDFSRGIKPTPYLGSDIGNVKGRISNSDTNLLNSLKSHSLCSRLGDFVDLKIGLVAGDIDFFTFNRSKIKLHGLKEKHFLPMLRSFRNNLGLKFNSNDLKDNILEDGHVFLLDYKNEFLRDKEYIGYLETYDLTKVSKNRTMQRREVWCHVDDGLVPDAFLTYMAINGPRLVVNDCKVNSFNNIHRVYFKKRTTITYKKLIAISLLTAFTQSVAELEAKQYGSKTLKIEPKIYGDLPIIVPDRFNYHEVSKVFNNIDELLRENEWDRAVELATKFIFSLVFIQNEVSDISRKICNIRTRLSKARKDQA